MEPRFIDQWSNSPQVVRPVVPSRLPLTFIINKYSCTLCQGRSCVSSWGRRTPQPPGTSSSPWSSSPSGPPESRVSYNKGMVSVADPHQSPAFHFDTDPDPIFQFDPIRILPLIIFQIWTLQCKNDPLRLPPFCFDADPDPAFYFDADADLAS